MAHDEAKKSQRHSYPGMF